MRAMEPVTAEDLTPGAVFERRHLDGAIMGDLDVPDVELLECLMSDCEGGTVRVPGLRSSGTTIMGCSFAALEMPGARLFSGGFEGVRIGSLVMDGADISVQRLASSRIDVLSIRDATARRIEITDSRIGMLDLTGSRVEELAVVGGRIDELIGSRVHMRDVDVSATELATLADPGALRGLVLSEAQALQLGPRLAEHHGASIAR